MTKWLSPACTAGILYLQFAMFATGALWILLGGYSLQALREQRPRMPGAVKLLAVICVLLFASLALGGLLLARARVGRPALIIGSLIAVLAAWWNVLAAAFWTLPLLFMCMAYWKKDGG